MFRKAIHQLLTGSLSRRDFITSLGKAGIGAVAAGQLAGSLVEAATPQGKRVELSNVSGGKITCETLKLWDVEYVFGNTGGFETGFLDALVDYPDIHYVLGLHEGAVMAMADGYARVSGKTAFVNIHSMTGTANALGLIINAWADNSAVVVSVGLSSNRGENLGGFTETNKLETIPELFTKQSIRASRIENLGESLRQSFRLASTLPSAPVFIGVPSDVWTGKLDKTSLIPAERTMTQSDIHPDEADVDKAAEWLARAENPLLISGAELPRWGGLKELVELSDLLGAVVSGDTSSSRSSMGFPSKHPRYMGAMRGPIKSKTAFDVVLIAGASRFSLARGPHPMIPIDAKVIELGIREDHLTRSYPADLLLFARADITLQKILERIKTRPIDANKVKSRKTEGAALKQKRQAMLDQALKKVWQADQIAPQRLAAEIDKTIDASAVVVTEGVTSDPHIWNYVNFDKPGGGRQHVISSGGSLGWGLGAGIGAKFAALNKQVVVLLGDGSYQFGLQALWTAKRFELPMIIVIFNNRNYQANRMGIAYVNDKAVDTGHYIGVNIDHPDIDHIGIAKSYGLDGERVSKPGDLSAALKRAVKAEREGRAYVLDVLISKYGGGADSDWYEKHLPMTET